MENQALIKGVFAISFYQLHDFLLSKEAPKLSPTMRCLLCTSLVPLWYRTGWVVQPGSYSKDFGRCRAEFPVSVRAGPCAARPGSQSQEWRGDEGKGNFILHSSTGSEVLAGSLHRTCLTSKFQFMPPDCLAGAFLTWKFGDSSADGISWRVPSDSVFSCFDSTI